MDEDRRVSDEEFERQFDLATKAGQAADATEPRAVAVRYRPEDRKFALDLRNDTTFVFPADKVQGLHGAQDQALARVEVRPDGESLYWPDLDVACTVPRLVMGFFGSKAWMSELARRAGSSTSEAKRAAVRENGKKGGRPKKHAAGSES